MFPALGVLSYRTVLLHNFGDLPLTFCLDHSSDPSLADIVSIVPSCGLVSPGSHQILILGTTPNEDSPKEGFSIRLQLNASKNTKALWSQHRRQSDKTCNRVQAGFSIFLSPCLLGAESSQCGGKTACVTGRKRQLVFPANSGGFADSAFPPHQEPESPASVVGYFRG